MVTVLEIKDKLPERFWEKIKFGEPDECWEWQAARHPKGGYGIYMFTYARGKHKTQRASRFLYESMFGVLESRKIFVCHKCDNPPCCNPNHFFIGTNRQNVDDMVSKGRRVWLRGEEMGGAILSEKQVVQIKRMLEAKKTEVSLAKMFSVARWTIRAIKSGRSWKHVQI